MRHVGKANAETVVIRANQRVRSLQIDVVAYEHQRALLVIQIDSARGVGEDDGADSHAAEHAHGERDFLCRISFIQMHAALHCGDRNCAGLADDHLSGVADRGRAGERGDFGVRDSRRVAERIGKSAETGTQHQANLWMKGSSLQNKFCSGFRERELIVHRNAL